MATNLSTVGLGDLPVGGSDNAYSRTGIDAAYSQVGAGASAQPGSDKTGPGTLYFGSSGDSSGDSSSQGGLFAESSPTAVRRAPYVYHGVGEGDFDRLAQSFRDRQISGPDYSNAAQYSNAWGQSSDRVRAALDAYTAAASGNGTSSAQSQFLANQAANQRNAYSLAAGAHGTGLQNLAAMQSARIAASQSNPAAFQALRAQEMAAANAGLASASSAYRQNAISSAQAYQQRTENEARIAAAQRANNYNNAAELYRMGQDSSRQAQLGRVSFYNQRLQQQALEQQQLQNTQGTYINAITGGAAGLAQGAASYSTHNDTGQAGSAPQSGSNYGNPYYGDPGY